MEWKCKELRLRLGVILWLVTSLYLTHFFSAVATLSFYEDKGLVILPCGTWINESYQKIDQWEREVTNFLIINYRSLLIIACIICRHDQVMCVWMPSWHPLISYTLRLCPLFLLAHFQSSLCLVWWPPDADTRWPKQLTRGPRQHATVPPHQEDSFLIIHTPTLSLTFFHTISPHSFPVMIMISTNYPTQFCMSFSELLGIDLNI